MMQPTNLANQTGTDYPVVTRLNMNDVLMGVSAIRWQ